MERSLLHGHSKRCDDKMNNFPTHETVIRLLRFYFAVHQTQRHWYYGTSVFFLGHSGSNTEQHIHLSHDVYTRGVDEAFSNEYPPSPWWELFAVVCIEERKKRRSPICVWCVCVNNATLKSGNKTSRKSINFAGIWTNRSSGVFGGLSLVGLKLTFSAHQTPLCVV